MHERAFYSMEMRARGRTATRKNLGQNLVVGSGLKDCGWFYSTLMCGTVSCSWEDAQVRGQPSWMEFQLYADARFSKVHL